MKSRDNHRIGRTKVKSGCRTCKIRKVKCDEGRPACHRCVSTGRVCDGYGIWGGGGNFYGQRQRLIGWKDNRIIPRPPAAISVLASSTEEMGYFEWFRSWSAIKLPGSFISSFWNTLLFQASLNEPAVLHAVLALSSVHKRGIINANDQGRAKSIPDKQEQFTLQQYIKAISHLQPYFSIKDSASSAIALITCIVFVYLEFLRGHFKTAQIHLQNGLKILKEMQILSDGNDGILLLKHDSKSTNGWIVETFSRLHLQVELFNHDYQHPCLFLQATDSEKQTAVFHSINETWQQMERLLNKVFYLTHKGRQQGTSECKSPQPPHALLRYQQRIRTELAQWFDAYEMFEKSQQCHKSLGEEKVYHLLYLYHTMAKIMTETCLQSGDESVFDSHTNQFVLIIALSTNLRIISPPIFPFQALPGRHMDMSRSIVDMGWIPPLYFTAVKCRVHRIRLQAIRLLESTSHREGIWDAEIAACVARKVMEVEERDFYSDIDTADDFPLSSSPSPQDLSLPILPESYRRREIEMILSGTPTDSILLFGKQKQEGIDCRVLISTYDVDLQCWVDGK